LLLLLLLLLLAAACCCCLLLLVAVAAAGLVDDGCCGCFRFFSFFCVCFCFFVRLLAAAAFLLCLEFTRARKKVSPEIAALVAGPTADASAEILPRFFTFGSRKCSRNRGSCTFSMVAFCSSDKAKFADAIRLSLARACACLRVATFSRLASEVKSRLERQPNRSDPSAAWRSKFRDVDRSDQRKLGSREARRAAVAATRASSAPRHHQHQPTTASSCCSGFPLSDFDEYSLAWWRNFPTVLPLPHMIHIFWNGVEYEGHTRSPRLCRNCTQSKTAASPGLGCELPSSIAPRFAAIAAGVQRCEYSSRPNDQVSIQRAQALRQTTKTNPKLHLFHGCFFCGP